VAIFEHGSVHISAKTDYAIRATIELAAASASSAGSLTAHAIADAQQIPVRFLLNILADLRRVGVVDSRRGPGGGWWLSKPAEAITVADIIRAVDGPLTTLTSIRPGQVSIDAVSASVNEMWVAVRQSIRDVLELVTLADLANGELPGALRRTTRSAC
jgi:Rrf2 family protein